MKKIFTTITFCFFVFIISAQNQTPNATTATAGQLSVTFAIPSPNTQAHYAVYITNSANALVNTLSYAYSTKGSYQNELTTMYSFVGNAISASTLKYVGTPDGFTSATISSNQASTTVYWGKSGNNATSVAALADGTYKVNFELVKRSNNRSYTSATFTKGPTAVTPTVSPVIATFTGISIQWTPAATGINNIELATLYSIYPNPATSTVFVNGPDIQSIDVFTLEGKRIFRSNLQKLNINALKKGTYLLNINTGKGVVSKKLIRN